MSQESRLPPGPLPPGPLPPGQKAIETFPRFGAPPFHERFPRQTERIEVEIAGDVAEPFVLDAEALGANDRVEQRSDFHCVTTWTHRDAAWSGWRFADVYRRILEPRAKPERGANFVVLRAQDGYRTSLPLEDLLASDVLLADRLDGQPLGIVHGAPIRLVAPAHYGYKNLKHLRRIELLQSDQGYRPVGFRFMAHPRARVAHEERGRWIPGPILRRFYRPMIRSTIRKFAEALERYERPT